MLAVALLCAAGTGCRNSGGGSEGGAETGSTGTGDGTDTVEPTTTTTTNGPGSADTGNTTTGTGDTTATSSTTELESSSGLDTDDVPLTCNDGIVAAGELCFGPPDVIEAGRSTAALALADFDGDTILDLVAGHDDGLSVRYGVGDGSFGSAEDLLGADSILALAVGELDDSAGPDIAAAAPAEDEVTLLFSTGLGFDVGPTLPSGAGPRALALGDFDGDRILDIAVAHEVDDDVGVALGNGDGSFTPTPTLPTGTSPLGLAAADLDGSDGDDLVVANFGGSNVGVHLSTGIGFMDAVAYPAEAGPRDVVLADFDDDGTTDLAAIHQDAGTAGFWPGNSDGSVGERVSIFIGANPRDALATDIDADGIPDMVVALQNGNAVGVLRGREGEGLDEAEVFATMSAPTAVAAGDLDGDGAIDLVTASAGPQGGIAVILATP